MKLYKRQKQMVRRRKQTYFDVAREPHENMMVRHEKEVNTAGNLKQNLYWVEQKKNIHGSGTLRKFLSCKILRNRSKPKKEKSEQKGSRTNCSISYQNLSPPPDLVKNLPLIPFWRTSEELLDVAMTAQTDGSNYMTMRINKQKNYSKYGIYV